MNRGTRPHSSLLFVSRLLDEKFGGEHFVASESCKGRVGLCASRFRATLRVSRVARLGRQ